MSGLSNGQTGPPVFVISGATGASGEQLVRTALAQFHRPVQVVLVPHVRLDADLAEAVENAAASGGTIVHTLVSSHLREVLTELAQARGVPAIDLMGPLLSRLTEATDEQPAEQPGLYRQQREA